ncbi:SDR family NAD(P)-dependent oxidoreductase [Microbacterium hibisci]|uniref:SDR family NAD(P)-dependent oxidoreductase n=1 Tax=Microbacterium hibisci TaxID=2036000 RepID=UPI001942655D|nr:SDR family oxidoreductase [Microbacterium hibisci]
MADASFVVTGGAGGVGRAIADRLRVHGHVVVIDSTTARAESDVDLVVGDAGDPDVASEAARRAENAAPLRGWVNNAAVFHDAGMTTAAPGLLLDLINANLRLALTGCHTAVNHFARHGRTGSIVNVSSHQAQRAVRGALPYATAKAAIEGLTRALAVDHGPVGIRVNAVALGSIDTERLAHYRRSHPHVDAEMATLHPLGRVGTVGEVAAAVDFLLSDSAGFINGVVLPVDGGRAAQGLDPEQL